MERKVSIVLNPKEKEILHQAGEILDQLCNLACGCEECPFAVAEMCETYNGTDYHIAFSKL